MRISPVKIWNGAIFAYSGCGVPHLLLQSYPSATPSVTQHLHSFPIAILPSFNMHALTFFAPFLLASATAADTLQAFSPKKSSTLGKRQTTYCAPVAPGANLCGRSCGTGYVPCVYYDYCFNPGAGQVCCNDGCESPFQTTSSIDRYDKFSGTDILSRSL